jgi:hypothetical protein
MRNTADVIGGKPIAVLLQSISDVSAAKCKCLHSYTQTQYKQTVHAHKCLHCVGIESETSCVVGEYSHHYATSAVNKAGTHTTCLVHTLTSRNLLMLKGINLLI